RAMRKPGFGSVDGRCGQRLGAGLGEVHVRRSTSAPVAAVPAAKTSPVLRADTLFSRLSLPPTFAGRATDDHSVPLKCRKIRRATGTPTATSDHPEPTAHTSLADTAVVAVSVL